MTSSGFLTSDRHGTDVLYHHWEYISQCSTTFEWVSCEVHIWWAGGAWPDFSNQHRLGPKRTEMRSWLIAFERLQVGMSYLMGWWPGISAQTSRTLIGPKFLKGRSNHRLLNGWSYRKTKFCGLVGDLNINKSHTRSAQKYLGGDIISDFWTGGREKIKFFK